MYVNCHSYYSLRYGCIPVEELVEMAAGHGVECLALTDINASTGVYDFIKACRKHHIHPVVGMEFRQGNDFRYILLARNNEGFREINDFRTRLNVKSELIPNIAPELSNVFVIYSTSNAPANLNENEFIGIKHRDRFSIYSSPLQHKRHKLIVWQPITFRNKREFNLHRLLRCIDNNTILSKLPTHHHAEEEQVFVPPSTLKNAFSAFPQALLNAQNILASCQFEFNFLEPKNKASYTGSRYGDKELLRKLVKDGFAYRYELSNKNAWQRVEKELEIIDRLGFGAYFLCTWDIVQYSLSRNYFHVGRGSGANSIVAYILKITNVCPIQLDLYFERFLNPARKVPPDFDIDWSWKDRDNILDYIFKRFDQECTAFCGTIGTFKHRSLHRELGKVFGLAKSEIDIMAKNPRNLHDKTREVNLIHKYSDMLKGFPNQRSMHACGVFLSELPMSYYTAMDFPPKGFRTAQIDMYIAEDIGFEKLDILSQRGLGTIKSTIELVKKTKGDIIDFNQTSAYIDHPPCNEMLSKGRTIGCFYVESPAMRGLLRRLRANNYPILVAASSVIRPGVAKSGMLREFQYRHNNPNKFEYFHPVFEKHLGDTYGVMVYQEDVIKIAHYYAGLDMADADILRRGMSGKTRSEEELEKVKERFFANCRDLGYDENVTEEVYRQIASFAGFSFCKSHSASYAVESYLALYLKHYHPWEFMVSAINNFGGFYRKEVYFHEASRRGAIIRQPCVNTGEVLASLHGKEIYIGFSSIEGFTLTVAERIVHERSLHGKYESLHDLVERTQLGIEHGELLIYCGALRCMGKEKNEMILELRMLMHQRKASPTVNLKLFKAPKTKTWHIPSLERNKFEDAFDEIELLGFPVSCSPFDMIKTKYRGDTSVCEFLKKEDRIIRIVGYLIARKDVPTSRGHMNFGTWIDASGDYFDTTHFPDILQRWPFKGPGCYLIQAKVAVEFGFPSLEVEKMERLPMIDDPRYENVKHKVSLRDGSNVSPRPLTRAPYPSKEAVDKLYGRR